MSFILDALKKSETDRQRQNGPALFEVRVAPPRHGLPLWAVGLAVLLAINLVIVAWVLLRRPAQAEVATAPAGQAVPGGPTPPAAAPQTFQAGQGGLPGAQAPPPAQGQVGPVTQAGQPLQVQPGSYPAGPQGALQGPVNGAAPMQQQGTVTVAGTAPTGPLAQTGVAQQPPGSMQGGARAPGTGPDTSGLSPDDYAPAADPPPAGAFGNRVSRGTASGVPLYQDAAGAPGAHIPELRLDLHVFAAQPQDRFVMINMHKLHEGDSLPEGVRVESITPEGAVLSKDGSRFLLPRE